MIDMTIRVATQVLENKARYGVFPEVTMLEVTLPLDDEELETMWRKLGMGWTPNTPGCDDFGPMYTVTFDQDSELYPIFAELDNDSNLVPEANALADALDSMDSWEIEAVLAALEVESLSFLWNGSSWNYQMTLLGCDDYEDYGRLLAAERGLPEWAEYYFDFAQYAEDETQYDETIHETSRGLLEIE